MLKNNKVPGIQSTLALLVSAPVGFAFVICFIYWIYLFFTSNMSIVYDAIEFEQLGRMLYQSGWVEFFKTGPHNEPLFPLLIAFSMRVADYFSISYQAVQSGLHILILFFTQLLTLFILQLLNISRGVKALIILYTGISPALVNATFSLWSEIAVFPLILGIILLGVKCWESILYSADNENENCGVLYSTGEGSLSISPLSISNAHRKIILWGGCLALVFILITSIKALFEYIFIAFMIPYFVLMVKSIINKERKIFIGTLIFFLTTASLFNAYLFLYKSLNQKYNGHYMLTDRGPYILYGNAAKRSEQLSLKRFVSGVAFVAGDGVCYKLFDKSDCDFWHIFTVEKYGRAKLNELEKKSIPNREIDSMLVTLAKAKILENPFQQTLLISIESFKMLFWESTLVGFVSYPPWLQKIFEFTPFKNGLRLLIFLITFISMVYVLLDTFRRRNQVFHCKSPQNIETHILFFILTLIMSYTALYSLFIINTRYASPIASLYLIVIAVTIQNMKFRKKSDGKE